MELSWGLRGTHRAVLGGSWMPQSCPRVPEGAHGAVLGAQGCHGTLLRELRDWVHVAVLSPPTQLACSVACTPFSRPGWCLFVSPFPRKWGPRVCEEGIPGEHRGWFCRLTAPQAVTGHFPWGDGLRTQQLSGFWCFLGPLNEADAECMGAVLGFWGGGGGLGMTELGNQATCLTSREKNRPSTSWRRNMKTCW